MNLKEWKLRRIARRLTHFELQEQEQGEFDLSDSNIEEDLFCHQQSGLFLNFYTRKGIENALKEYGIWDRLIQLQFSPYLIIRPIDSHVHLLRVTDGPNGPILMEMQARLAVLKPLHSFGNLHAQNIVNLLGIEWLLLQNPTASFKPNRQRLPGQEYPGLSIGREIMVILGIMVERLHLEGLLGFPLYYHNGYLYHTRFHYFSPEREGELLALKRDLKQLSLTEASWAIKLGLVLNQKTEKPYVWRSEEMIWPITTSLKSYFADKHYLQATNQAQEENTFTYDIKAIQEMMQNLPYLPAEPPPTHEQETEN